MEMKMTMKHKHQPVRATCENIGLSVTPQDGHEAEAADFIEKANRYFSNFAAPVSEKIGNRCFHCGEFLTGFFGSFRWGIAHGEGNCGHCGWPARGHHFADIDGEKFTLNGYVLSYLPEDFPDADSAPLTNHERFAGTYADGFVQ